MVLEYKSNDIIISFIAEQGISVSHYKVKTFARNPNSNAPKQCVYTSNEIPLQPNENRYFIAIDHWFYHQVAGRLRSTNSPLPNWLEFSFSILIGEEEVTIQNVYHISIIHYLSELLKLNKFKFGPPLLDEWFLADENDEKDALPPKLNALNYSLFLQANPSVKQAHNQFIERIVRNLTSSATNEIKTKLIEKIGQLHQKDLIKIPSSTNTKTTFGSVSEELVFDEYQQVPQFHIFSFYEQDFADSQIYLHECIDGLRLTNMSMHATASGELEYNQGNVIIHVKNLNIYLKDAYTFDYDDEVLAKYAIPQKNVIQTESMIYKKNDVYSITQNEFTTYRDIHQKGGDYFYFSTLHSNPITIKLNT